MNSALSSVIRGSQQRKTRFHDEKGNRVDIAGMCYAPAALCGAILRRVFGYRPVKPTISFRATKVISSLLQPDWRCVEFGSGMSTAWLASRCGFLLSIENDLGWYDQTKNILRQRAFDHVQYELREDDFFSDMSGFADRSFDFAMIDGWDRAGCAASVLPKIKSGGWVYLDNSDKDMEFSHSDSRIAEDILLQHAKTHARTIRYFVDFSRTNFFVEQGLLVQV